MKTTGATRRRLRHKASEADALFLKAFSASSRDESDALFKRAFEVYFKEASETLDASPRTRSVEVSEMKKAA